MAFSQKVCLRPPESSSRRSSVLLSPREALPISAFAWGGPHILARRGTACSPQARDAQDVELDTRLIAI
jgi:hypothetical protein